MNITKSFFVGILAGLGIVLVIVGIVWVASSKPSKNSSTKSDSSLAEEQKKPADKLEVYYFHRTARCYSCKTIGQYVKEVMKSEYSKEIQNGLIDFKELNVELPENKGITEKYQASGSSLFINRISNDIDNIERDVNVWRLLGNEEQFKEYLTGKINLYLGL